MASETVPGAPGLAFLKLHGRYLIDPANTQDDLLEDAFLLLAGGLDALEALADDLDSARHANGIWCVVHMLKQAKACLGEAIHPTLGAQS